MAKSPILKVRGARTRVPATNIATASYAAAPEGSNLAVPPHEIPDTQARYIQDAWLDDIGEIRRRGQVAGKVGVVTLDKPVMGLTQTADPTGIVRIAAVNGDSGSGYFSVLSDDKTTKTNLPWANNLGTSPYHIHDAKPCLNGGVLVGVSSKYTQGAAQALAYWRGSNKANYTTGTFTVAQGATDVYGTGTFWSTNADAGMFLFGTGDSPALTTYFGSVKQVVSDTHLILDAPAPLAATAKAYTLQALRGVCAKYYGYCTTDTTNASVTGQDTSFVDNQLSTGTWALYRQADMKYIGQVSSVTSNTLLTLTANSTVGLNAERFIALRLDGSYALDLSASTRKVGFLNATWRDRQWTLNNGQTVEKTLRLWFSDNSDFEATDLSEQSGDFIDVISGRAGVLDTAGQAVVPTQNALLVLKETEAFAVTGTAPENFTLDKIGDDGCLCGMSVQQYMGGAIWAGFEGIYYFDGTNVTNLIEDRLGLTYKAMVRDWNSASYRVTSMLARDHYIAFFERVDSQYTIRKGTALTAPAQIAIAIYIPQRAVTFVSNLEIRGAMNLPLDTGLGVWYAVTDNSGIGHICDTQDLFEVLGPDQITCSIGNKAGPDFYLETKRYNFGDPLLKKLFKQVIMTYFSGGDALNLDTVVGLNEDGTTASTQWPTTLPTWASLPPTNPTWQQLSAHNSTWATLASAQFVTKRIKFLKRSQHLAFRIWQASGNVTNVEIGPWSIGFKPQRPGRI